LDEAALSRKLSDFLSSREAGQEAALSALADHIAPLIPQRRQNVAQVIAEATQRLHERRDQPGPVSARVLQNVIEVAASQDDAVMRSYLGGVLASSTISGDRDDRAATWCALIDRLSSYTVRSHYVLYMSLRKELLDRQLGYDSADMPHVQIFIDTADFALAVGLGKEKPEDIAEYVVSVLLQESLVMPTYGQIEGEMLQEYKGRLGMFFSPSTLGIQLFLWGHGFGDLPLRKYLDPTIAIPNHPVISLPSRAVLTKRIADDEPE
jgi:hypothetical protein